MKKILIFLIFIVSTLNIFCDDDYYSDEGVAKLKKNLYVVEGKGEYKGFKEIKGFEDKRFKVYYEGTPESYHITYDDLRKINLNEVITWKYNGVTHKHKRTDIYSFFADSIRFSSKFNIEEGTLSQEWLSKTFGKVYDEWFTGMAFSENAERITKIYFETLEPKNDEIDYRDIDFSKLKEGVDYFVVDINWLSKSDLDKKGLLLDYTTFENAYFVKKDTGEFIEIKGFNKDFKDEKTFDGIKFKKLSDTIFVDSESLKAKKLISQY